MRLDHREIQSGCKLGALVGLSVLALVVQPASTASTPLATVSAATRTALASPVPRTPRGADFGALAPTADVRWLVNWIAESGDHGTSGFIVVDKRAARAHVFDADARWVASSAVLLGAAIGDESVPGIGSRPMATIKVHERTTPAGRFVAERGRNAAGEDVVWVDYDAALSMHRVRLTNPREHRAERLASPSAADNRISYGCINVPVAFYEQHVQTMFARRRANIYVLPDVRSVREVFGPPTAVAASAVASVASHAADRSRAIQPALQFAGAGASARP